LNELEIITNVAIEITLNIAAVVMKQAHSIGEGDISYQLKCCGTVCV
jgi:hypothetical protein